MTKVKNYLSLVKFSHTIFAMPFAVIGFFLGLDVFLDLSGLFTYSPVLSGGDDKDFSIIFTWKFWLHSTVTWTGSMMLKTHALPSGKYRQVSFQKKMRWRLPLLIVCCLLHAHFSSTAFAFTSRQLPCS